MSTDRSAKIIATVGTALIAALVIVLLMLIYLRQPAQAMPPERAEILLVEEEYVEVLDAESEVVDDVDASAYLPEPEQNEAQPTPPAGTDLVDKGTKSDNPPAVIAAKDESPVKVKKETRKDEGPKVDKKKLEEEQVRREASNEVANAFKNASGKHNTATGAADNGNSGTDNTTPKQQGITGTGKGSVGGGWIIPKYGAVRSTVTGSINMIVKIDATGCVTSVVFEGGTPPAATDAAVKAAVEREIRAHKFSRTNFDNAEAATAYITYTFK